MEVYNKLKDIVTIVELGTFEYDKVDDSSASNIIEAFKQWIQDNINSNVKVSRTYVTGADNKTVPSYRFTVKIKYFDLKTDNFFKQLRKYCGKKSCFRQFLTTLLVRTIELQCILERDNALKNNMSFKIKDSKTGDYYYFIYYFKGIDLNRKNNYLNHDEKEINVNDYMDLGFLMDKLSSIKKNDMITIMRHPLESVITRNGINHDSIQTWRVVL